MATCETNGHLWGPAGKCIMCKTPKPAELPPSKELLPELPKHDHAFQDPEGERPDILVWREQSMRAYAALAVADHKAEIERLQRERDEYRECAKSLADSAWQRLAHEPCAEPELREFLGKLVRMEWMQWAREQPNPKPSWLVPWDELSEPDREVDRRIGERIYKFSFPRAAPPPCERHERRVVGHASGWQEQTNTCVCGQPWPCPRAALPPLPEQRANNLEYAWLGMYRDYLPPNAVSELQGLLGPLKYSASTKGV